jgi:hypothetical protein
MAVPVKHPNENMVFRAPPGMEDTCSDLSVRVADHGIESVWELTDDEVWDLIKSRKLMLLVVTGTAPPPVWIGVIKP